MNKTITGNDIAGATLLTAEQASGLPAEILKSDSRWWLKTPGYTKSMAALVNEEGSIDNLGYNVETCGVGLRPALLIKPEAEIFGSFKQGHRMDFRRPGYIKTQSFFYIGTDADGKGMLIPKECIGRGPFRTDWKAENANGYAPSDAKQEVDKYIESLKNDRLTLEKTEEICRAGMFYENEFSLTRGSKPRRGDMPEKAKRRRPPYKRPDPTTKRRISQGE